MEGLRGEGETLVSLLGLLKEKVLLLVLTKSGELMSPRSLLPPPPSALRRDYLPASLLIDSDEVMTNKEELTKIFTVNLFVYEMYRRNVKIINFSQKPKESRAPKMKRIWSCVYHVGVVA